MVAGTADVDTGAVDATVVDVAPAPDAAGRRAGEREPTNTTMAVTATTNAKSTASRRRRKTTDDRGGPARRNSAKVDRTDSNGNGLGWRRRLPARSTAAKQRVVGTDRRFSQRTHAGTNANPETSHDNLDTPSTIRIIRM